MDGLEAVCNTYNTIYTIYTIYTIHTIHTIHSGSVQYLSVLLCPLLLGAHVLLLYSSDSDQEYPGSHPMGPTKLWETF